MFPDDRFVGSQINTVHFVTGYVAMKPLNVWTQLPKNHGGLLGELAQLYVSQFAGVWDLTFNHVFWHITPC